MGKPMEVLSDDLHLAGVHEHVERAVTAHFTFQPFGRRVAELTGVVSAQAWCFKGRLVRDTESCAHDRRGGVALVLCRRPHRTCPEVHRRGMGDQRPVGLVRAMMNE
jgi:hypothetical protein